MNNYIKCHSCGAFIDASRTTCPNCGRPITGGATTPPPYTPYNGAGQQQTYNQNMHSPQGKFSPAFLANDAFATGPSGSSRGVAALLALLLGTLGIHYFYLGKTTAGIIMLVLSILSCGITSVLGLAQGIYMLVINNMEFYNKYVNTTATFPLF